MRIGTSANNFYQMTSAVREGLAQVQQQIATGQKNATYGSMGMASQTWLDFSAAAARASALMDGIDAQQLRLKTIDSSFNGLGKTLTTTRSLLSGGLTAFQAGQSTAQNALVMITDLLNAKNGKVPLFGGAALSGDAVISAQAMIDGDATQPGLRALIHERIAADTGGNALGRLGLSSTGTSLTLSAQGGAFGYTLKGATTHVPGLNVTQAAGPPVTLTLSGNVTLAVGDQISFKFGLPDGSEESLTLVAGEAGFSAGPFNGAAVATALGARLAEVTPALKTASALAVAKAYFAGSVQRVSGIPAANATALAPATTMPWYLGKTYADPRQSVQALVGEGQTIRAGVQANESVFADLLSAAASLAVLVEDPAIRTREGQTAMQTRILPALSDRGLAQMQTVFGLVQNQLADAKEVQRGVKTIADNYLSSVNRTDNAEAAAQLLALQNQLQASYQAGANILKLSLVNYL